MSHLFVRLPNHLGDACMALPALDLLAARGFELTLVGRAWARSLFEAYRWPVVTPSGGLLARIGALRTADHAVDADTRGLLFTNSFSTALEFRLARLRSTGYATDARNWLLADAVQLPNHAANARVADLHMVDYYFRLAERLAGTAPVPDDLNLRLSERASVQARKLCADAGVEPGNVMLCPVAVGLHRGRVKAWQGFGRLSADLAARGVCVVACPGPGEHAEVRAALPTAIVLPSTDVGTFAALLAASRLVVANDSGPGHLAAAVGTPLVSVFGVTEPARTRPWGRQVRVVGGTVHGAEPGWPSYEEVAGAVNAALSN